MTCPAHLPEIPQAPHSYQLSAYSRELLSLSGVPTDSDDPEHALWRRLDEALTQLDARLNREWELKSKPGHRFIVRHWMCRAIEALAEHFGCTKQAIIRQFIAMCPAESFPTDWLDEDRRRIDARQAEQDRIDAHRAPQEEVL